MPIRLNDEVNLAVRDRALALRLESGFTADLARCERVTEPQWPRRPAAEHVLAALGALLERHR